MIRRFPICMLILLIAGCATPASYDRDHISQGIKERADYELGAAAEPGQFQLPEEVSPDDGLTENEAVTLALWNNAQFQADLASLGFVRADLIEAGMLSNPTFSLLFPVGPKQLETTLKIPIEALWQRPRRIAASEYDAERLSENLVANGLGLIRDVRTAYTELLLAEDRVRLAKEDVKLREQRAQLAQIRLEAGDISEMESSIAQVDALRALDTAKQLSKEAAVLRHQLIALLGITSGDIPLILASSSIIQKTETSVEELLETALAARPDLRAAELSIEAAGERVGWEKSKIYRFIGIIDADDDSEEGFLIGPGLEIEIPILNQNEGKIARAKAELEQSARQYEAVRQNIILQVNEAYTRHVAAHEEHKLWHSDIIPSLEKAVGQAQKSFAAGEVSYLLVLETEKELIAARMRQAELAAEMQRTAAQLNYSVGKKVI